MIVLGIDPGLSGAVAVWRDGAIEIHDMPVLEIVRGGKGKRDLDAAVLADCIEATKAQHAFLEQVWSMPGDGKRPVPGSHSFAFGKSFGIVIGILATLDIPFTLVPAARWKKAMQVPASKDGARARASQLMPKVAHYWPRVRDDGRAEAALIALYGVQHRLAWLT